MAAYLGKNQLVFKHGILVSLSALVSMLNSLSLLYYAMIVIHDYSERDKNASHMTKVKAQGELPHRNEWVQAIVLDCGSASHKKVCTNNSLRFSII